MCLRLINLVFVYEIFPYLFVLYCMVLLFHTEDMLTLFVNIII